MQTNNNQNTNIELVKSRKVRKKNGFFYFRKKNYALMRPVNEPAIKLKSYIDNCNDDPKRMMISGCILLKENVVEISESEYEFILNAWENLNVVSSNDFSSIYSCMRYDNGEFKKRYKDIREFKEVLFIRTMTRPEDNFEAYMCHWCGHYHIGKRDGNPYKRNVFENIVYFFKKIKFNKKLKKSLEIS